MLISIVLDPHSFSEDCVRDKAGRKNAERLLNLVLTRNVVLLSAGAPTPTVIEDIFKQLKQVITELPKELSILLEEIQKGHKRCVVRHLDALGEYSDKERIKRLALDMRADLIVSDRDHYGVGVERCPIVDYFDSNVEKKRASWDQKQRLDTSDSRREILGRAVGYAKTLRIADRHFGIEAKRGQSKKLAKYARGVMEVVGAWVDSSPFSDAENLQVLIVTLGGNTRAAGGYVDPEETAAQIKLAIEREDRKGFIKQRKLSLTPLFKEESDPPSFQERYLVAGKRCYGLEHGVDGLDPEGGSPCLLDQDCKANRDMIRKINGLKDATGSKPTTTDAGENLV